jgi:hypothetical protein
MFTLVPLQRAWPRVQERLAHVSETMNVMLARAIASFLIRVLNVVRFMPRRTAAPFGLPIASSYPSAPRGYACVRMRIGNTSSL